MSQGAPDNPSQPGAVTAVDPATAERNAVARAWLFKHGVREEWALRHVPAPWNKAVRVSALSIAAYQGDVDIIKWLFERGCGALDDNKLAPMRIAVQRGAFTCAPEVCRYSPAIVTHGPA